MSEHNNKREFVKDVVDALVKHGDGRYDWMIDAIRFYENENGMQVLANDHYRMDVTCDSLTSILNAIYRLS